MSSKTKPAKAKQKINQCVDAMETWESRSSGSRSLLQWRESNCSREDNTERKYFYLKVDFVGLGYHIISY